MKTLVLSVVIAMTFVLNTVSGNNLPEFAYNTTTNGEQVESQTVYTVENGKYLHPHLKYNYTYNADGSVSKKEVLKWSEIMQVFEKQYCLNFTHDPQENSIEYAAWDAKTDSYSDIKSCSPVAFVRVIVKRDYLLANKPSFPFRIVCSVARFQLFSFLFHS